MPYNSLCNNTETNNRSCWVGCYHDKHEAITYVYQIWLMYWHNYMRFDVSVCSIKEKVYACLLRSPILIIYSDINHDLDPNSITTQLSLTYFLLTCHHIFNKKDMLDS